MSWAGPRHKITLVSFMHARIPKNTARANIPSKTTVITTTTTMIFVWDKAELSGFTPLDSMLKYIFDWVADG
jgi:hypothetical protein